MARAILAAPSAVREQRADKSPTAMATSKRLGLLGVLVLLLIGGLMWLGCQKYDGESQKAVCSQKADNVHGLKDCQNCDKKKENDVSMENFEEDAQYINSDEGIDITVAYTDVSGDVRTHKINSRDLSSSWVWENPGSTEKAKVVLS